MSLRALVTGATGFIGGHVCRALLAGGYQVRILCRARSKRDGLQGLEVEALEGELLEPASLRRAVADCDLVCHLAARMTTRNRERERMFAVNVGGSGSLFQACLEARVPRILYAASIFALGAPERDEIVDEEASYNLASLPVAYFQSRRAAEEDAWRFVERGLPLVFLYPGFCFGPGDVYISSTRILLDYLRGRLPIYPRGGLNAVDVRDVATGFVEAATKAEVGQRYLLGGVNLSYRDLFRRTARIAGRVRPFLPMPTAPLRWVGRALERGMKRPPLDESTAILLGRRWYYDSSRARRTLDFQNRGLDETLRDTLHDFHDRGLTSIKGRGG